MNKATKFIYVPLDKVNEFQKVREENDKIIPCNVYINKKECTIYFVEQESIDNNIESILKI